MLYFFSLQIIILHYYSVSRALNQNDLLLKKHLILNTLENIVAMSLYGMLYLLNLNFFTIMTTRTFNQFTFIDVFCKEESFEKTFMEYSHFFGIPLDYVEFLGHACKYEEG